MAVTFTTTQTVASTDYERYVYDTQITKTDRYKDARTLDFSLAPIDASFVKLNRGAYITVNSTLYPKWFTGYIINEPELTFLGRKNNTSVWGYKYQATSDEYILSLKPLGIVPPFMNQPMGNIIKLLANMLAPGVFDVTNVQNGPIVAQYTVDPTAKFNDIVQEFCESASFLFYGNNKKLYFAPQDASGTTITLDGNNKHFTPANLTLKPNATPLINDTTVLGDIEPQAYVHEYFVGTGFDASFPLVASVFGLDNSILIDENFSGSNISAANWNIFDTPAHYLQVSSGYLNVTGGDGAWNISLRSINPLPMDGRYRFTHGEWDFLSGNGIIAGLWTQAPNSARTGCLYALNVAGATVNPIVNSVVDSTQSLTVDVTGVKRYVIRTLVEFEKTNRLTETYAFIDATGTRSTLSGAAVADTVKWSTIITEVDVTSGSVTNQVFFNNTATLSGTSDSYATYIPVVSNSLHATVSGVTVSIPLNATLETASKVSFTNLSFEDWTGSVPDGWINANSVFAEDLHSYTGLSLKMQADAAGNSSISQAASDLILPNTTYTINVRVRRTNPTTTGQLRFYLNGTGVSSGGLAILASSMTSSGYQLFTGTLTTPLSTIPPDLVMIIDFTGATANVGAVYVDDIAVLSAWQAQIIGPNEIDASDGLAPVATIVGTNAGADTKSSISGSGQYNPGQSQLVFFKDSITRTSNIPPADQVIRLSYRSAGPAVGRAVNRASINTEAANWFDDGVRSIVKTDLTPKPRTSIECEMAAAAFVSENSFTHYEGTYTQWSTYFTAEPIAGAIIKFTNMSGISASLQAEEIHQVVTTLESSKEFFQHNITFGKPDHIRRLLAQFDTAKGVFQKSAGQSNVGAVNSNAIGLSFAPDITKPDLVGWDDKFIYASVGQSLASNGLFFEARVTDDSWGVDDGRNLITRSSSTTLAVPRALRGKVFFIRQAISGNKILYSEDLTKSNYSGGFVVNNLSINPDGGLSDITSVSLGAGSSFTASATGLSGSTFCFTFNIRAVAGVSVTANFGGSTVTFKTTGLWQRISVPRSGSYGNPTITSATAAVLDLTRFSIEQGTLVETAYSKTNSIQYGPVSRYSAVMNVSFPAPATTSEVSIGLLRPAYS